MNIFWIIFRGTYGLIALGLIIAILIGFTTGNIIQTKDGSIDFAHYAEQPAIPVFLFLLVTGLIAWKGLPKLMRKEKSAPPSKDWIMISENNGNKDFDVRQRTRLRLLKVTLLGLSAILSFLITIPTAENYGLIFFLLAIVLAVAFTIGLFPAVAGLLRARRITFSVTPTGMIIPNENSTTPYTDLNGPFWERRGKIQAATQHSTFIADGTGMAGASLARATAVTAGTQAASNALARSAAFGLNTTKSGTESAVYMERKGRRIYLARLLNEMEARHLCDQVAIAIESTIPTE